MLSILNSAFAACFRWLLNGAGIKLIMVAVFGWVMSAVVSILVPLIPGTSFIQDFASAMSPGDMWWIRKFRLPEGLTIGFGTIAARFLLRRIPVIG